MIKGIDCAVPLTTEKAKQMKALGYDFVGRYFCPEGQWKRLNIDEARLISDAGMRLLCVYETTADRVKGGAAAGAIDGARAYNQAIELGMPLNGIIYFAVDYEAQPYEFDTVEAYLRAARAQTGAYEIGVYGSYAVIEAMYQRQACKAFWQCVAWSYGKLSTHHSVYQCDWNQPLAGHTVDFNTCPDMDAAGLWSYNVSVSPEISETQEGAQMTDTLFKEFWDRLRKTLQDNDNSDYSMAAREWAKSTGLMQGNGTVINGEPNYMWEDLLTREQFITVLYRFAQMIGKA